MNILEKILEEIEDVRKIMKSTVATNCFGKECENDDCTVCVCERVIEIIRSHMDEVNDTNVPSNWIPVEERLPEEGKEVLAQFVVRVRHTNGKVDEAVYIYPLYYEEGKWKSFHGMPNGKVEAWQLLPESYKGGKENE